MLITKFNRMIRNKWVWTGFALLISASFLGYFSPQGGCGKAAFEEDLRAGAQGKLFDNNVPRDEFIAARYFEMGLRENANITPEAALRLHQRTWMRLAALQMAEKMGITTSPEELNEIIRKDPTFIVDGSFNRQQYQAVVERQLRVGVQTFEQYLYQEITLQKLARMMESILLTSPVDIEQRLANLTDIFTVQYSVVQPGQESRKITVAESDAESFYNEHRDLFIEPEKVNLDYVAFPIPDESSITNVTEQDIKEYYSDNEDEFQSSDTNATVTTLPLDEVKDKIASRLKKESAILKARDTAADFVMLLVPDRAGTAKTFPQAATHGGLSIQTSGLFSLDQELPGLGVGPEFNSAAFDLDPSEPSHSFSDPVVGSNSVYVLLIKEKKPERMQAFSEVKAKALELAKSKAAAEAFTKHCDDLQQALSSEVKKGTEFAKAAKAADLKVISVPDFSVYEGVTNEDVYAEDLIGAVMPLSKGEISQPVSVTNGVLLVYVKDRVPGEPSSTLLLKPQVQSMLDRYNTSVLFHDWQKSLLAEGKLTDYAPLKIEDQDDEDATSSTEPVAPEQKPNPVEP